ncbi:MAG: ribbon-helix-helix protein, CopG family [Candidatus Jordarchaeum sp.]|uniref:ribbon-helix-helix protein, CopG family n=1 Tax=Candidatus Jordarchaeum sp. TaxID=2823881 RepID=UPI00404AEDA5
MKIVQISLSDEEYETLRKVLKKRGMNVKEGVREAIRSWLVENRDFSDDPFVKLEPVNFKLDVECTDHDKVLY